MSHISEGSIANTALAQRFNQFYLVFGCFHCLLLRTKSQFPLPVLGSKIDSSLFLLRSSGNDCMMAIISGVGFPRYELLTTSEINSIRRSFISS